MAGFDEASARFVLAQMQDQLARDPVSALGVAANATSEDVRAAFLALTKQYHPVRFGRMAPDIQRLSNEVFLALRAAHDAIARSARPRRVSAPPATAPAPPTAPSAAPHQARPLQPVPRAARAAATTDAERPVPSSMPSTPASHPATPVSHPVAPGGKAPAARSAQAPARPAVRPVGAAPPATARDEAAVLDLLQRQQWDQARTALHQLTARDPSSRRIRALMCYARGREAQLAGRVDDARVELQDALDLDPDLQPAKAALMELFTRRK